MKRHSREFSIIRACLLGASLVSAGLLAPQAGWAQEAEAPPKKPGNMIFFRGGYTQLIDDWSLQSFTDTHNTLGLGPILGIPTNNGDQGWYVGAGIEHLLTPDIWGMAPGVWMLGEIAVEFKKYESDTATLVVPTFEECTLRGISTEAGLVPAVQPGCVVVGKDNLSMFTFTASPKFKFMEGSRFRPWVIPAGLDISVVNPPSDSANYLDVGVVFAAGAEYELTPGIKLGIDGRYHFLADFTDPEPRLFVGGQPAIPTNTELNNDNWTVGGYLGIGF